MIAIYTFEQMHSKSFELVGADTRHYGIPGLIQIGLDIGLA